MNSVQASLDSWTLVFLIAAAQGLFLAMVLFLLRRGSRISNYILGTIIFLFSLTLVHYVAYWTGYQFVYPHLIGLSNAFPMLFGPLFLFYLRSLKQKEFSFRKNHLLHLIPFALVFLYYLPFYIRSAASKVEITNSTVPSFPWVPVIILVHLLIYAIAVFREFPLRAQFWLRMVALSYYFYFLGMLSYYVLVFSGLLKVEYDYMISFIMAGFIYYTGYQGFAGVAFRNGRPRYQTSTLTPFALEEISKRLRLHMDENQPYTDNQLRLSDLARQLNLTSHQLSQVINEQFSQSFSDFVNSYRIRDAKQILANPKFKDQKIINVAYEVGFNTKASFNNWFKRFTGMSPTQYRESIDPLSAIK